MQRMPEPELIACQIESVGVNGVGLARGGNAIGFRGIPLLPGVGRFDGKLVIATLSELGPHDPADQYHHVAFRVPVTPKALDDFLHIELLRENTPFVFDWPAEDAATVHLHWTFDGSVLLAKFETTHPLDFLLLSNGCVGSAAVEAADESGATLAQDGWRPIIRFAAPAQAFATAENAERLEVKVRGLPLGGRDASAHASGHRFHLTPRAPLYVSLSESGIHPEPATVDARLEAGRSAMAPRLMDSTGAAAGCADAIQRLVGFSSSYDVRVKRRFVPVNRDWSGPNSTAPIFMWDNFFDSYLASLFTPDLGKQSLGHILDIIRTRGIPGAPCQRNLIVPIVYSKMVRFMGDEAFARESFPVMMRFMRFWFEDRGDGHPWRDGNDDGLIECGTCQKPGQNSLGRIIQDAFDETGYDDSPMYSKGFAYERGGLLADGVEFDFHRGTLNLTMVGQNSLYVGACRAMAVVAHWLGMAEDEAWLAAEAERVAGLIRQRLYSSDHGFYQNRFVDGHFSSVLTMDIFYPLLAGVCGNAVQQKLRSTLLDPAQFWGENVIPTVSRSDPAYRADAWRDPYWKGSYWRGNVWPPTNYITYLAIRNAGWADVAGQFSVKSRRLFMDDWTSHHHAMENYPPEGRTTQTQIWYGNGGRDPHYIWAGLLPLIALEQLFSVEDVCDGLRFGTTDVTSFGSWSRFHYHGKPSSIESTAQGVRLEIPGELTFTSDAPLAVRRFVADSKGIRFVYDAPRETRVSITCRGIPVATVLPPGTDKSVALTIGKA